MTKKMINNLGFNRFPRNTLGYWAAVLQIECLLLNGTLRAGMNEQQSSNAFNGQSLLSDLLWQHKNPTATRLYAFRKMIEAKYDLKLESYEDLRQWTIHNLSKFWAEVWHFTLVRASSPFTEVLRSFDSTKHALTSLRLLMTWPLCFHVLLFSNLRSSISQRTC